MTKSVNPLLPWLCAALALCAATAEEAAGPAVRVQSLADRIRSALLTADGWEIRPIPGATVAGDGRASEFCGGKRVDSEDVPSGPGKTRALIFRAVGKSSHLCDSPTQISKVVEIPESLRLSFFFSGSHADGVPARFRFRVTDEEGKRTLASAPIKADRDHDILVMNEFLFLTDRPRRVRFVIDTTCRTFGTIQQVRASPYRREPLSAEDRREVDAAVRDLGDRALAVRGKASAALRKRLERDPTDLNFGRMFCVREEIADALCEARGKTGDPEIKARIDGLLAEATSPIIDLSAGPRSEPHGVDGRLK